jgi:hypothetical protein
MDRVALGAKKAPIDNEAPSAKEAPVDKVAPCGAKAAPIEKVLLAANGASVETVAEEENKDDVINVAAIGTVVKKAKNVAHSKKNPSNVVAVRDGGKVWVPLSSLQSDEIKSLDNNDSAVANHLCRKDKMTEKSQNTKKKKILQ